MWTFGLEEANQEKIAEVKTWKPSWGWLMEDAEKG
jgi:hypothetical protein